MLAVGGFFTITVCIVEVTLPHEFVVVSEIEYVPGVINWNDGLADADVEPAA